MDINANLTEQRRIIAKLANLKTGDLPAGGPDDLLAVGELAHRLAELAHAADEFLSKRGALPLAWGQRGACPNCGGCCGCVLAAEKPALARNVALFWVLKFAREAEEEILHQDPEGSKEHLGTLDEIWSLCDQFIRHFDADPEVMGEKEEVTAKLRAYGRDPQRVTHICIDDLPELLDC